MTDASVGPVSAQEIRVREARIRPTGFSKASSRRCHQGLLEDQQAQHHFSRSTRPAAATALGMPLRQRFVHGSYDLFVRQHLIGVCHPAFAEVAHFLSNQSIAEAELRAVAS